VLTDKRGLGNDYNTKKLSIRHICVAWRIEASLGVTDGSALSLAVAVNSWCRGALKRLSELMVSPNKKILVNCRVWCSRRAGSGGEAAGERRRRSGGENNNGVRPNGDRPNGDRPNGHAMATWILPLLSLSVLVGLVSSAGKSNKRRYSIQKGFLCIFLSTFRR